MNDGSGIATLAVLQLEYGGHISVTRDYDDYRSDTVRTSWAYSFRHEVTQDDLVKINDAVRWHAANNKKFKGGQCDAQCITLASFETIYDCALVVIHDISGPRTLPRDMGWYTGNRRMAIALAWFLMTGETPNASLTGRGASATTK
ncbi:MAG: hypothetical protein Q8O79_00360 [Pseudomonadota bacterium]|nr:hypothetical protein [Pseudomonadota bacterium]